MSVDFGKGGIADVGDGVFVYVGPEGDSNNGIVLTGEGTISIDSYVKQYAGLVGALKKVSDHAVRLAINTHDDADHYSMNHFFRRQGAMIVASEVCRARIETKMGMASWVDDLRRRNPALAHELTKPEDLVPHIGLQDRATLKIGGENVDPMEVEAFLTTHPAIDAASVVGLPDARLSEVAVAFVRLAAGSTLSEQQVIAHCRGRVASFKIPRHVCFVDDFPMTSSGKVQKVKLRERARQEWSMAPERAGLEPAPPPRA